MTLTLRDKRIFMLEDNLNNASITQLLLERYGAKVMTDRWARETVKRLENFMPAHLIILDLMLPNNISGFDVFEEIRSHDQFAGIPAIVVSASDPAMAIAKAKAKGLSGFIAKPIDFVLFPQQIMKILEGEEVWHTGRIMED
jgi:two-component system, cell cycle response regulator DivK